MFGRTVSVLAIALGLAGCSPSSSAKLEYDPLRDETTSSTTMHLSSVAGYSPVNERSISLHVNLSGTGKHPKQWRAYLAITVWMIPTAHKSIFGKEPTLTILVDDYHPMVTRDDGNGTYEEHISLSGSSNKPPFDISINQLVSLAQGDRFAVNGEEIRLTPEQRSQIRDVVIAARAATAE